MSRNVRFSPGNLNSGSDSMRLDLFLKRSRMIPRRALAHEICDRGDIWVNGRIAKGSRLVKVGDLIQWRQTGRVRSLKVSRISSVNLEKEEASSLYENVSTEFASVETREILAEPDSS
jgi:ribosomal 50S subunit-recycling heat shock protein